MNLPVKIIFTAALALAFITTSHAQHQTNKTTGKADTKKAFFKTLKKMWGVVSGETQFPPDPNHPLAGKKLVMSVDSVATANSGFHFSSVKTSRGHGF